MKTYLLKDSELFFQFLKECASKSGCTMKQFIRYAVSEKAVRDGIVKDNKIINISERNGK